MQPIIIQDYTWEYRLADINTNWDIDRLEEEWHKLAKDFYSDNYEWEPDFYDELAKRTWLNIYQTHVLYLNQA